MTSAVSRSTSSQPSARPRKCVSVARAAERTVSAPDSRRRRQPARDHAQRADAVRHELEDRRRCRVEVRVEEAHLVPHVAARVVRPPACRSRPVVPAQARDTDRPREAAEEERRVRRSRDRREDRRDAMQRALVAEPRESRKRVEARPSKASGRAPSATRTITGTRHEADDIPRRQAPSARSGKRWERRARWRGVRPSRVHSRMATRKRGSTRSSKQPVKRPKTKSDGSGPVPKLKQVKRGQEPRAAHREREARQSRAARRRAGGGHRGCASAPRKGIAPPGARRPRSAAKRTEKPARRIDDDLRDFVEPVTEDEKLLQLPGHAAATSRAPTRGA